MRRQAHFAGNEAFDPRLSLSDDDDIEDGLDQLGYDNDCSEKLQSLYPNDKKGLSNFSDYYQTEVHKPDENSTEPVRFQPNEENLSDSFDDSISDEDNVAATKNSLAYQCGTSELGEKYKGGNKFEGSDTSEWIKILEESSGFRSAIEEATGNKGKTKLGLSQYSNSNLEQPIAELATKDNSCPEDERASPNDDFEIEDINEEDDTVPYKLIPYERKEGPQPSMVDLLEGLQGKNCPRSVNSNVLVEKATDKEEKKRIMPNLGERTLESEEDPPEYMAGHTSSDEEDIDQNKLSLLPQQNEGQRQTMADLFQEAFNASNDMWPALPAANSLGSNYHGRLLQVMQLEKEKNTEFSRFSIGYQHLSNSKDKSTPATVQIMSRSLEGRLIVCRCLFQLDGEVEREGMVIFNPKLCENVDLVVGDFICIHPPWKEVSVREENIILCSYYSSDVA